MAAAGGAAGAVSLLLDLVPAAVIVAFMIAFIKRMRKCRAEERMLREVIETFSGQSADREPDREVRTADEVREK